MTEINYRKLSPETIEILKKVEQKRPEYQQLLQLTAVIKSLSELVTLTKKQDNSPYLKTISDTFTQTLGLIKEINQKELPSAPDYQPIADALKQLETALAKTKPIINLAAPKVEVKPTPVVLDFKEISSAIKKLETVLKPVPVKALSSEISKLYFEDKAVTAKHAPIDVISKGYTKIIKGKIRVLACFVMSADHSQMRFLNGEGEGHLSGLIDLKPTTGFVLPYNQAGWLETSNGLYIEQTHEGTLGGLLTYIELK